MIDLSIVVVTWNGRELVLACLDRIERELAGMAVETIVVDNGSSDGSAAAVRERHPWATTVELPRNLGFAGGCNAGLRQAKGRALLLLNNDALVTRAAVEACLRELEGHPDVGGVGPQLLHPDGRPQNSVHAFPGPLTELVPGALLSALAPARHPSKRRPPPGPVEVDAVLGAALFVRRQVLERVGLLDEGYFFFLEETDWCWRMREAGFRVRHVPDARMVHTSGASSKRVDSTRTRIEFHRSLYRFVRLRRGRLALAVVVALRCLKNALPLLVPPLGARGRERWRDRVAVLAWHARGCPADAGLAGAGAAAARGG